MTGSERTYRFGSFALEYQTGLLYHGGELVSLPPKVSRTLLLLVENHGKVVAKEVLLQYVWPDAFVEEGNLHHNVSVLRKLLQSNGCPVARIDTLPKRGYRFVGEVTLVESEANEPNQPAVRAEQLSAAIEPPTALPDPPSTAGRKRQWFIAAGLATVLCLGLVGAFIFSSRTSAGTERGAVPASSIAVLPFSNFSSDPQGDYLADGLADELINALTRVPGLNVVARTSSFQFKGKPVDLRRVGAQLQARMILEGSVQKDGNRLRVTAQLIDAATGFHVWSQRFDRQFDDIFVIQDEICQSIANALSAHLPGPAGVLPPRPRTANVEVYALYLRGIKEWNRRSRAGVKTGQEFFERALALDATYAPAWAGLADIFLDSALWGILLPGDAFPKARAAAQRAIELDGQLPAAYTTLGYIQGWHERNHQSAKVSFRRALDLSPNYSSGRQRFANYLSALGRHEEAIGEYRRALELDPISPTANSGLALVFFWARQYDRAIEQCAKTRDLDPQFPLTYYYLAHSLEQKHKYDEAITALQEGTRLWGSTDGMMLAELYAAAPGHRQEGLARLEKIRTNSGGGETQPYQMALIYAALGDRETALHWLERSSREGDVWALYANVDPRLDLLRSDPRFRQLLKRLGAGKG
ncbi:MAG: winged helix-turn-helix domain-containing tetratricopeptide repeat protein [Candidatus Solibacter sp.]